MPSQRTRRTTYANLMWRPWKPMHFAVEIDFIRTTYLPSLAYDATVLNAAAQLMF